MKTAVFWVVALRRLVEIHRRFSGVCCLHHQGDDRAKTAIFNKCSIFIYEIKRNFLLGRPANSFIATVVIC
jgi:hypothetical protein